MPAPKIAENTTSSSSVKAIEFSIENTPSRPPWTTFTGVLEARRDSVIGKRIIQMDPKATDGKHKDHTPAEEWVRGLWTAPADWSEVERY